jgi:hypothetical protein
MTWFLAVRHESNLQMLQKEVLRKTYGSNRAKENGRKRPLCNNVIWNGAYDYITVSPKCFSY